MIHYISIPVMDNQQPHGTEKDSNDHGGVGNRWWKEIMCCG